MIALSLLAGLIPHILTFFSGMLDRKQELSILQLQLQMSQLNINAQLQEVGMSAQIADKSIMYNEIKTSIPFIDGLNGAIRPVIALLYTGRMLLSITHPDLVNLLDYDHHIFAAIIAFYFGGLVSKK